MPSIMFLKSLHFKKSSHSCQGEIQQAQGNTFLVFVCVCHTDIMVHYFCPNDKSLALFFPVRCTYFCPIAGCGEPSIGLAMARKAC